MSIYSRRKPVERAFMTEGSTGVNTPNGVAKAQRQGLTAQWTMVEGKLNCQWTMD